MRVLLTRGADDAARTRAILERLGHRVMVSPVIVIQALGGEWPRGVVDAVLATSGQAFLALADNWGPIPEVRRLMPLWLVGQRTEDVARDHGFAGASHVAPNAVSLAFEMGKRRTRDRVVYLTGRHRKPDIETALNVMEQSFEVIEVYEAKSAGQLPEATIAALAEGMIDVVLHFSRRSAELFVNLATPANPSPRTLHVCLSSDVAGPITNVGWRTVTASGANEASMVAAIPSE